MKHFIYFSAKAATSGKALSGDLMKAGRIDIAIHSLIQGLFLSHDFRKDIKFHFVFCGMPDPPKHIEIQIKEETKLSKKDVGNLIKKVLYKYKQGRRTEAVPGCFVEKKSFLKVIEQLISEGKEIFILDKEGENLRKVKISDNSVFVIGDQNGFPKKELKRLKKTAKTISVGPNMYFASQVVTILNNEIDLRGF